MKRTIIVLILILSCMPYAPIRAQPDGAAPYFEYPTETWIIESQDYFGAWIDWMFVPVGGQSGDKRVWNFTWILMEYDDPINGTVNPIYEIREADGNETKLRAIYNRTEPLQFKTWGDFKSDVSRLDRYPITPEDKEEFTGLKANIDLLNDDSGAFLVSFKDKWKLGKKITIGFGTTITYSGATNAITITGGTIEEPITFWDIWNASNSNGWNVVQNNNNSNEQYEINAQLLIGDAVEDTYFNDTDVSVYIDWNWPKNEELIEIKHFGHFTLGELIDREKFLVHRGVYIARRSGTLDIDIIYCYTSATASYHLYGCEFQGDIDGRYDYANLYVGGPGSDIINCIFNNIRPIYVGATFVGNKLFWGGYGIYGPNKDGTFNDNEMISINYGYAIMLRHSRPNATFRNLKVRGYSKIVRNYDYEDNDHLWLIDTDSNNWNMYFDPANAPNGTIWRQNTFNLKVGDNGGLPIEDATVTLIYEGQGGGTIGSFSTFANGSILEQVITKATYNRTGEGTGGTEYLYEPYTLTITKDGYIDYSVSFNISAPISWIVGLEPLDVIFSMELLVLAAVSMIFMLMMLFSSQPGMGVISGTLAFMFWFATGMYYMYTNIADQYAIGYLFIGLGLICGIFTVYCGLKTLDPKKASKDSDFL